MKKVICSLWPACGCDETCEARVETTPKFFTVERVLAIALALGVTAIAIAVWSYHG